MPTIKYRVQLSTEERAMLEEITRKERHNSQTVLNALILLNCDDGPHQPHRCMNEHIASILHISMKKIDRVKCRCVEQGIDVALEKQPEKRIYSKKADGDFEAHVIALSCSSPPEGFERWSLRLLADRMVELKFADSITHETIRRVQKKSNYGRGKQSSG